MKKPVETAEHPAVQAADLRFEASYREAWGVWTRLLHEEFLKAAFTSREDAIAFANKNSAGGQRGEIRKVWVLVNETRKEAYLLGGSGSEPLQAVDLDFNQRTKMELLRRELLTKLSDDELQALGLRRG